jgi:hypothetical protein
MSHPSMPTSGLCCCSLCQHPTPKASVLVTDTFSTPAAAPPLDLFSNAVYFVRAMMQQLSLHVLPGNEHLTFLLTAPSHEVYGEHTGNSSSSSVDSADRRRVSRAPQTLHAGNQQSQHNHQQQQDAAGSSSSSSTGSQASTPFPEVRARA